MLFSLFLVSWFPLSFSLMDVFPFLVSHSSNFERNIWKVSPDVVCLLLLLPFVQAYTCNHSRHHNLTPKSGNEKKLSFRAQYSAYSEKVAQEIAFLGGTVFCGSAPAAAPGQTWLREVERSPQFCRHQLVSAFIFMLRLSYFYFFYTSLIISTRVVQVKISHVATNDIITLVTGDLLF